MGYSDRKKMDTHAENIFSLLLLYLKSSTVTSSGSMPSSSNTIVALVYSPTGSDSISDA